MKTEYILFLALPKTMVEARKLRVLQNTIREGSRFCRKGTFAEASGKKPCFPFAGAGENILWTVTSVESYHWF